MFHAKKTRVNIMKIYLLYENENENENENKGEFNITRRD